MKKYISVSFLCIVICCILFTIKPAITGNLTGVFAVHTVPREYYQFGNFLTSHQTFSRSLWVPTTQRFGFFSSTHPAVSAYSLFNTSEPLTVAKIFEKQSTQAILQESSIAYVIVPFDSQKEIFLNGRKYDNGIYLQTIKTLRKISWLREIQGFGKIHVFVINSPRDHFWLTNTGTVSYTFISPTKYTVDIKGAKSGEKLIFSESYNPNWKAKIEENVISSMQYHHLFNSFIIPKTGNYSLVVYYLPQELTNNSLWISGTTTGIFLCFVAYDLGSRRKDGKIRS